MAKFGKTLVFAAIMAAILTAAGCRPATHAHGANSGDAAAGVTDIIRDSVSAIAAAYPGEIGVALIVNDSDTVTVNDLNIYPMMSVFKLHQALALCSEFDARGTSLDTLLTIRRADLDPDTWSPMLKDHGEPVIRLTVRDLLRYSLTQSDNNASNLMFSRLVGVAATDSFIATVIPRASFNIAWSEAEMSADHDRAYANSTSPLGAAMLMNRLFADSIVSPASQTFIKTALGECRTGNDRIAAPLTGQPGVTVAHKTGSGYTTPDGILVAHNDVGRVTLPDGTRYTLAVFVMDFHGNETQAAAAIARISSAVYTLLTANTLDRKHIRP